MPLDRYSTGTRFEALAGYSRAVADKDYVHISGTVGGDPETGEMPENVDDQLMNILAVIEQALAHFGATLEDVTRTRVYITSMGCAFTGRGRSAGPVRYAPTRQHDVDLRYSRLRGPR